VQTAGVTEDEFQKARNTKETGFIQGLMSLDGRLSSLAWYALYYGNANLVNDEIQRYMAVTRADIQRVAGTYLTPERRNAIDYVVKGAK
jgi:zinc protease